MLCLCACSRHSSPPTQAELPPLQVEYARCVATLPGPICVPDVDGRLTLWIAAAPDASIRVEVDGAPAKISSMVQNAGGNRYELTLDPGDAELRVSTGRDGRTQIWRMGFQHEALPVWLAEAKSADRSRDFDRARLLISEQLPHVAGLAHRRALSRLARVEWHAGNAEGAEATMRRAIAEQLEADDTLDLVDDSTALAYVLILHSRFADARTLLSGLTPSAVWPAEARYYFDYYNGLLAAETGDLRNALYHFDVAARQAERVDLAALRLAVAQVYAVQLAKLGRWSDSSNVLKTLMAESPGLAACDRGTLLTNVAWVQLLARETDPLATDPAPALAESKAAFDDGCPEDRYGRVNLLINLALARLQAGDPEGASAFLEQAWSLDPHPAARVVLWRIDLEGRLALAKGNSAGAQAAYERLAQLASANYAPDAEWRALVGQAQALRALGDSDGALAAYDAADMLLQQQALAVAIDEGRETLLASLDRATRAHLGLLLERGRVNDALLLARRSRTRVLRDVNRSAVLASLTTAEREQWDRIWSRYHLLRDELTDEARNDYTLAADTLVIERTRRDDRIRELQQLVDQAYAILARGAPRAEFDPPAPGEVLLLYQPLETGWIAFAQSAQGIESERVDCIDTLAAATPGHQSACLLEPFRASIDAAQRVRVLASGPLQAVDFHALPWDTDTLLAAKPVVYGLDLGEARQVSVAVSDKRALLVGDPLRNLRAARDEVREVGAILQSDWQVQRLVGSQAQYAAVLQGLANAELFHYAGHGHFSGRGGWGSVLTLAPPAEITIGDILGLGHAPRWVVLSGCDTGRTATDTPAETLGLAQAFLSNGSQMVVAATRPVADETALALIDKFYEAWKTSGDAGEGLRQAQLALHRERTEDDWSSFRLFEP